MKTLKITYWATTALIAGMMCFSAFMYLTDPAMAKGFQHLGFPGYFRVELAIAKLLGAAVLLLPLPGRVKEWAYAGFTINFLSAFIAHVSMSDPVSSQVSPLLFLGILAVSYFAYHKLQQKQRALQPEMPGQLSRTAA